ncbi:hypothetical protein L210DRAFT_3629840 [Boletus edulis BED1]|uniref:Uncharacterized protein n=1 Tax=Boletus edulis BED1 TaxID=1328754 RepID=A0AAD4BWW3_BOLED|nr:hypothetical protein L210DRAFT_3629840 [Boletus edulis BED1]
MIRLIWIIHDSGYRRLITPPVTRGIRVDRRGLECRAPWCPRGSLGMACRKERKMNRCTKNKRQPVLRIKIIVRLIPIPSGNRQGTGVHVKNQNAPDGDTRDNHDDDVNRGAKQSGAGPLMKTTGAQNNTKGVVKRSLIAALATLGLKLGYG